MDYTPANLAPLGGKQADYFMDVLGPYDLWAIQYGYTDYQGDILAERFGLRAIAGCSREFGHDYASDENADNIDPTITRFDLSADPLEFRLAMMEKARKMLETLDVRYPRSGQSYYEMTRLFSRALRQYQSNGLAVARFVGGIVTERNHAGDKDAVAPVRPVPFADQRRALSLLCEYIFADTALRFSPRLLADLQQNPAPMVFTTPQDVSILDTIAAVQTAGLYSIRTFACACFRVIYGS